MLTLILFGVVVALYLAARRSNELRSSSDVPPEATPAAQTTIAARAGQEMFAGDTIEWIADEAPEQTIRRVGPMTLTVVRQKSDDKVAPVVTVALGDNSATMVGEMAWSGYTHRISVVQNVVGAPPAVMLQGFTGGAHCCTHVQVTVVSGARLKVVDLGLWEGEEMALPVDISGDGIADFVNGDNAFYYAFAPYAAAPPIPPVVHNITSGRLVDVSRHAAFRRLYVETMTMAGETCRNETNEHLRNGACATYVASAARVGKLSQAWIDMIRSYAADQNWEYPSGCAIIAKGECPESLRITYKSYPEALLAFLKSHGYVAGSWTPPETSEPAGTFEQNAAANY